MFKAQLQKQKKPFISERLLLINMAATYSPALLCSTIGHEGLIRQPADRHGKRSYKLPGGCVL
jgi:hypothetical protein